LRIRNPHQIAFQQCRVVRYEIRQFTLELIDRAQFSDVRRIGSVEALQQRVTAAKLFAQPGAHRILFRRWQRADQRHHARFQVFTLLELRAQLQLRKPGEGYGFAALAQILPMLQQVGQLQTLAVQHLPKPAPELGDLELIGSRTPQFGDFIDALAQLLLLLDGAIELIDDDRQPVRELGVGIGLGGDHFRLPGGLGGEQSRHLPYPLRDGMTLPAQQPLQLGHLIGNPLHLSVGKLAARSHETRARFQGLQRRIQRVIFGIARRDLRPQRNLLGLPDHHGLLGLGQIRELLGGALARRPLRARGRTRRLQRPRPSQPAGRGSGQ
jgi:hypothetical protein